MSNSNKRIIILSQYFPPDVGGASSRAEAMVTEISKYRPLLLITSIPHYPNGSKIKFQRKLFSIEYRNRNLTIIRIWMPSISHNSGFKRLINYFIFSFLATLVLIFKVKKGKIIWGISPNVFNFFPGYIFSKFTNIANVSNIDDLWPEAIFELGFSNNKFLKFIITQICRLSYNFPDALTPISPSLTKISQIRSIIDKKFIKTVYNGFMDDRAKELVKLWNNPTCFESKNEIQILYSGILGPAYDFEYLISCFVKASVNNPDIKSKLIIRGIGPDALKIRQLIDKSKNKNINLINKYFSIEKLNEILINSDFLILPMKENFISKTAIPIKILEYMAVGRPIIISGKGQPLEFIKKSRCGIVSHDSLYDTLNEIFKSYISDSKTSILKSRELGYNGSKFISKYFLTSITAKNAINFLEFVNKSKNFN